MQRGLTDLITPQARDKIKFYLRYNPARGPTQGLPYLGQVDLTLRGFEVWQHLWRLDDYVADEIESVSFVYREPRTAIVFACDEWSAYSGACDCELTPIGKPEPIGPWRSCWWHLMQSGVTLRCVDTEGDPMLQDQTHKK